MGMGWLGVLGIFFSLFYIALGKSIPTCQNYELSIFVVV